VSTKPGQLHFTRTAGVWTQQQKLIGTGAVGAASQGVSIALSGDAQTIISGGPVDNSPALQDNTGAAWIFVQRTKEDCKNGGWLNFAYPPGPFTNQGQCVNYFAKQK
jgi:hypothetical protein